MEKRYVKLPGVKFVLLNDRGKEVGCGVTNRDGELSFERLAYGRYFLKEIECPCRFELPDKPVEVWIGCDCPNRAVEIINERKKGSIKIYKLGECEERLTQGGECEEAAE